MRLRVALASLLLLCTLAGAVPAARTAKVDPQGVLRWTDDNSEVALFGVNYYTPFSIDYALLEARGLSHEQAIRDDVQHFARLGLTSIRLHCWDREISDREGNLVDNEHLRLLDLLISECQRNGIYCVMTPIAWWGAPKPGGFSDLYSIQEMTSKPEAWAKQARYLGQYLNHVNRYTKLAYKDDPAIVALELINEPLYPADLPEATVTTYINTLAKAVRDTGCRKPVFYNCWQGRHAAAAASTLDGVTFGWYPTGLVSGGILTGNFLPRVNDYPDMRDPAFGKLAKMVYEFDEADVPGAVLYPAMARTFRSGGAQIANQFQYEALCLADGNPNWQTHYLNLAYTPSKALGFAIAAEAMRRLPRLRDYGPYPESCRFGDFRVDYEKDLSELVTADTFLYTSNTDTRPPSPEQLTRVAGCGSSPVVRYPGTGAYFLDRVAPGVWQLQVYPDAVMVADPFAGGTNEKVRVLWARWPLTVTLPDLGPGFRLQPLANGKPTGPSVVARQGEVTVGPGAHFLVAPGRAFPASASGPAFVAPPSSTAPPTAFAQWPRQWREGVDLDFRATVAAVGNPPVALHVRPAGSNQFTPLPMRREDSYGYVVRVPGKLLAPGVAESYLSLGEEVAAVNLPGGDIGDRAAFLRAAPPVELLHPGEGTALPEAAYSGPVGKSARVSLVPGREVGQQALRLEADGFGPAPSSMSMKPATGPLPADLKGYDALRLVMRGGPDTSQVEVTLVQSDGQAFGNEVLLGPVWREVTLPLAKLQPRWGTTATVPDLTKVQALAFVTGTWILGEAATRPHAVEVASATLLQKRLTWELEVAPAAGPVVLVRPADVPLTQRGRSASWRTVGGMDAGRTALSVHVEGFGPEPDYVGWRIALPQFPASERPAVAAARTVILKARATEPQTDKFELVLIEEDGSPWGVGSVPLTTQWQEIRLPLESLEYFKQWGQKIENRGGAGDRFHPENVQSVNFCFGAWLYGDQRAKPHGVEIQEVSLGQ